MSRRGRVTELEERDYYSREGPPPPPPAPLPVRTRERERDYEEIDTYSRRGPERDRRPEFLREDYGRPEPGPVVLREREVETFNRPIERRRSPSAVRRYRSPSPAPPQRETIRTRERFVERSPSPRNETTIRTTRVERRERSPSPPPPQLRARVVETTQRFRERSPSPVRIRERIIERERSPSPQPVERVRTRITERETRPPSPSPSPSPPPIRAPPIHQEIITHHRHIDHGFERARAPTPPPPARKEKTEIDIYTSRNNTEVDITKISNPSRSRTPQPHAHRDIYEDTYIYESDRDKLRTHDTRLDIRRSVSSAPRDRERERVDIRHNESESDFYARKTDERAVIGEAFNGHTKDWSIVDVPPGTERVRMDGVGGGGQEITWQRYNGVRRSRFIPEREKEFEIEAPKRESSGLEIEIHSRHHRRGSGVYEREYERIEESGDRRLGPPRGPSKKAGELWTEITKDLVVREAIEQMGYDFEETEFFYYVIQYLGYEDVLELVQLSDHIRRERQDRLREIERERIRMEKRERERDEWERAERRRERDAYKNGYGYDDERIIEREVIYDGRRGGRRVGW
ncbi:hypothetical protein B7494_g8570 [Chlorociboria aeruginascens]|nr:hypothetical protein B7494_g8570 [Chlorociboria aeruginascens]